MSAHSALARRDMFCRVEQLVDSDRSFQGVVRSAELAYLGRAKKENWLALSPVSDPEAVPPQWEAGLAHLEAAFPLYMSCCARLARHPAELDTYIGACVSELADKVFEYKVLFHSRGPLWTSDKAKRRFAQLARNRLATMIVEFRTDAWTDASRSAPPCGVAQGEGATTIGSSRGGVTDRNPIPIEDSVRGNDAVRPTGGRTGDAVPATITPVERRCDNVNRYKRESSRTVAQICKSARVDRSDLYKWMKGKLPDTSAKSIRIEQALRSAATIRSGL